MSFVLHLIQKIGVAEKTYDEYADILKVGYSTVARGIEDAVRLKILHKKSNPVEDSDGRIIDRNKPNTLTVINEKVKYWLNRSNRTASRLSAAAGAPQLRSTLLIKGSSLDAAIGKLEAAMTPPWVKRLLGALGTGEAPS